MQRRILHTMKRMDDGRYNKVANVVGEAMKLHPHGDAVDKRRAGATGPEGAAHRTPKATGATY